MAITTLYRDVERQAKKEEKIPVLALHERNMEGFLIAIRPEDLPAVCDEYQDAKQRENEETLNVKAEYDAELDKERKAGL